MNIFSKIAGKTMMKNRTRTLVTIIGIILSAAMFTAVTTTVSSYLSYFRGYIEYNYGNWEAAFYGVTGEQLEELCSDPQVGQVNYLQQIGFAEIESKNENKPYLCVAAVGEKDYELLPIHLTEGRMPENAEEILLPKHLESNGGFSCDLGDTLKLSVGTRVSEGMVLDNHTAYYLEQADSESLENTVEHTYTVVGFYSRPSIEDFSAPGYTAITLVDQAKGDHGYTYEVYFKTKNESEAVDYFSEHIDAYGSGKTNKDYLRAYGLSGESRYNTVLYGMAAILIGIILFGSVALIYNAFSISVSERTRLFGILSSIGATRKQLVKCVLTEGVFLGCIGVPLGILAGILGMWITFQGIGTYLMEMLYENYPKRFTMQPSLTAILIAVLIAYFTIFLSAYIPVKKALKHTAIETIRQGGEIKLKGRQVKTSSLTKLLFGFEGMLASKNFKRNRKKYRATVISLFVSVVLFISASSFCAYLERSVGTTYESYDYDIVAEMELTAGGEEMVDTIKQDMMKQSGVTQVSYSTVCNDSNISLDKKELSKEAEAAIAYFADVKEVPDQVLVNAQIVFMEDEGFESYAASLKIDVADYLNSDDPKALVYDEMKYYSWDDNRYHLAATYENRNQTSFTLALVPEQENIEYYGTVIADGIYQWNYQDWTTGKEIRIPAVQNCDQLTVSGALVSELPGTIANVSAEYGVVFIFPYSQMEAVYEDIGSGYDNVWLNPLYLNYAISSDNHSETTADINVYLDSLGNVESSYVYDYAQQIQEERSIVFIIDVFSYGFIILISLIALANVFNTISTNIQLRSREFAMLRSVGMTPKGMYRMMNYECLLYGIKGLLYGLPVSVALTYLIYRVVLEGVEMRFFIPWYSLAIAIGSVFLVVFSTMVYSMRKLQKENTMDALKKENI